MTLWQVKPQDSTLSTEQDTLSVLHTVQTAATDELLLR